MCCVRQIFKEIEVKVGMAGDSGVGKSCMVRRYITGDFQSNLNPTIGIPLYYKRLPKVDCGNGYSVKLRIQDTSGEEKFRSLSACTSFFHCARASFELCQKRCVVCAALRKTHDLCTCGAGETPTFRSCGLGNALK